MSEVCRRLVAQAGLSPIEARSRLRRFAFAAASFAAALLLRLFIERLSGDQNLFLSFYGAVMVSACYGGLGPGLAATMAASGLVMLEHGGAWNDPGHLGPAAVFVLVGVAVSVLNQALHQSARSLREALASRDEVLQTMSDAYYALDRDWTVTFVNAAAERFWGRPGATLLGRRIWEAFPGAVGSEIYHAHLQCRDQRRPVRYEGLSPLSHRWIEARLHPSDRGVAVFFRDITDLKRSQEELERLVEQRTSRLREVNEELETFTYSASHDLRAPLRKITAWSELIESEAALPERSRAHFERIKAAARDMNQLIDELLNLAEATQKDLVREPVDLSEMARAIVGELLAREPSRAVTVSIEPGMLVTGDRRLLWAVLHNLLDNAWKFTRSTPEAAVEVGKRAQDHNPVFFVRDNGVGFDMAHSGKLFTAFERLHRPGDFAGTGVGLAIARRVVRRHGGEIWAESEPGRGAAFYFTLPGSR